MSIASLRQFLAKVPRWAYIVAGVALVLVLCIGVSIAAASGGGTSPAVVATHTAVAASKPGPPYVGGPYTNFTHTYGQPFNVNGWFYGNSKQTLIFAVTVSGGIVTMVSVLQSPDGTTDAQTMKECEVFLPSGASEFNAISDLTDYHSSVGEIVIQNAGQGTCTISLSSS